MPGFNIETFRKANRIALYIHDNGVELNSGSKSFFWAYLKNGFNFSINSKYSRWGGQQTAFAGDGFLQNLIAQAAQHFAGVETVIDFHSNLRFLGSDPLTLTLPCFLYAQSSWQDDIEQPWEALCKTILPARSDKNFRIETGENITELELYLNDKPQGFSNWLKEHIKNPSSTIWEALNKGLVFVKELVGEDVYLLEVPDIYKKTKSCDLVVGPWIVENVIVKSVSATVPQFIMEGGLPNYMDISITIETNRSLIQSSVPFSSDSRNKVKVLNTSIKQPGLQ